MKKEIKAGYVYILSTPVNPGILKIGKTTRNPNVRLKEINSATGVIQPFKIEAIIHTKNPSLTESLIHKELIENRVNKKREFFQISILEATKIAKKAAKQSEGNYKKYTKNSEENLYQHILSTTAIFVWIASYSAILSLLFLLTSLWTFLTRKPKIFLEVLTGPKYFGLAGTIILSIIIVIPIVLGHINYKSFSKEALKAEIVNFKNRQNF